MTETPSTTAPSRVETITVLAAVAEADLEQLSARLEVLRARTSPFARTPSTHFARLLILRRTPKDAADPLTDGFPTQLRPTGMRLGARLTDLVFHLGRPQKNDQPDESYLLFAAAYDEPGRPRRFPERHHTRYIEELRERLRDEADRLFELCVDYPGRADADRFGRFFADRTVPAGYVFRGVREQPAVETVRTALRRRREVIRLAVELEGRSQAERAQVLRTALPALADLTVGGPADASDAVAPLHHRTPLPRLPLTVADGLPDYHLPLSPPTEPTLDDVQNLVTSGYRRHQASRHLLLRVTEAAPARAWLARVADVVPTADWAQHRTHRLDGPVPASAGSGSEAEYPGLAVHVALSFHGLTALELTEDELKGFPDEFQSGMAARESALAPGQGTRAWTGAFAVTEPTSTSSTSSATDATEAAAAEAPPALRTPVDVLLMLSGADPDDLTARIAEQPWLVPGAGHGLEVLDAYDGGRISSNPEWDGPAGGPGGFVEHFGFLDGISQPRIHGVTVGPGAEKAELPAGEALLGYRDVDGDTAGRTIDPDLARNGSFLVYRKLHQDVAGFRELTAQLGRLMSADGTVPPGTDATQLAAAKVLGRWPDGTPLTLEPAHAQTRPPLTPFGYQDDDFEGRHCPVGAHIRRANPRDSRPVDVSRQPSEGGDPGLEGTLALRHRMLRRGIPYGPPLPEPASGQTLRDDDGDRGLLFVALVGDIRRQFEFIQANWLSDGNTMRLGADRDPLSGASPQGSKFTVQGDHPTFLALDDRPLVTCLGGEYFFLPGLKALRHIARAA